MDEDLKAARIAFIREVCRADEASLYVRVMTVSSTAPVNREVTLFGAENFEDWMKLLGEAIHLMPESEYTDAIVNAIGWYVGEVPIELAFSSLTFRRRHYVEQHQDVSERTLQRWEQRGAEWLSYYMEVALNIRKNWEESPQTEGGAESAALRARIDALESVVASLAHLATGRDLTEQKTKDELSEWSARREFWDATRTDD